MKKNWSIPKRNFYSPFVFILNLYLLHYCGSSLSLGFLHSWISSFLILLQSWFFFNLWCNINQSHWRSSFCKVYCKFFTFLNKSNWAFLFVSTTAVGGGDAPPPLLALRDVGGARIVVTTSISCGPILSRLPVWWGELSRGLLAVEGGLSASVFMWWRIMAICFPLASIFLKSWSNSSWSFLRMLSLFSCLIRFERSWWLLTNNNIILEFEN